MLTKNEVDYHRSYEGLMLYCFTCGKCKKVHEFAFRIPNIFKCDCENEINARELLEEDGAL